MVTQRNAILQYIILLKTESLDNTIEAFSMAYPLWYMGHYTTLYEYVLRRTRDFLGRLGSYFNLVFYI